jgi:hypothetical protein
VQIVPFLCSTFSGAPGGHEVKVSDFSTCPKLCSVNFIAKVLQGTQTAAEVGR